MFAICLIVFIGLCIYHACEKELPADYHNNWRLEAEDETNGFTLVYVFTNTKQKFKTKDYLLINQKLVNTFEHVVPVFCFDTLNGMQRKRFIEESISFQITGKETFICAK